MTRLAAVKRRLLLATDHLGPVRMRIREGPAAGTVMYAPLRRGRAYSRNRHEPHIAAAIATTACPGMIALDIGAYLGYFSLMMALAVGPTGHVFSFEPADEALTAARRIARRRPSNSPASPTCSMCA